MGKLALVFRCLVENAHNRVVMQTPDFAIKRTLTTHTLSGHWKKRHSLFVVDFTENIAARKQFIRQFPHCLAFWKRTVWKWSFKGTPTGRFAAFLGWTDPQTVVTSCWLKGIVI